MLLREREVGEHVVVEVEAVAGEALDLPCHHRRKAGEELRRVGDPLGKVVKRGKNGEGEDDRTQWIRLADYGQA